MFDVLIRNGRVIDGTGNPWVKTDICIIGDRIAEIGSIKPVDSEFVLNAEGHIVAPGFIDIHTHNELTLMINLEAEKLHMGVTTEILGTCGVSAPPFREDRFNELGVAFYTVGGVMISSSMTARLLGTGEASMTSSTP